jgi:hypothetical protein
MNTARAKPGIATADDKEVVDFAERLRYILELNKQTKNCYAEIKYPLEGDMLMIRIRR